MNFKNLNIDQNKIDEAIQEWSGLDDIPEASKRGNGYHYKVAKDDREALIVLYKKTDGTTTINPSVGKNPELSKELAKHIVDKCLITTRKSFSLSFRDVNEETYNLLCEFLTKDIKAEIADEKNTTSQKQLKVKGPYKDEISIIYYNNKTVLIQGKPLNLYIEIKLFFYDILSFDEVVKTEAATYEIDIKVQDIRNELKSYLPNSYSFLDDRIIKIITPALSLAKLEIVLEDYSSFAFPALRGLEGYIRKLLTAKGNENYVKSCGKLGSLFRKDHNNIERLQEFARDDIECDMTIAALEKSYNLWKSKRHPYFHVDIRTQITPIIWKKEDAEELIFEVLNTIEETYSQIINNEQ